MASVVDGSDTAVVYQYDADEKRIRKELPNEVVSSCFGAN